VTAQEPMTLGKPTTLFHLTQTHHSPPLTEVVTPVEETNRSTDSELGIRFGQKLFSVRLENFLGKNKKQK
jgi:hypothetical protein